MAEIIIILLVALVFVSTIRTWKLCDMIELPVEMMFDEE